MRNHPENSLGCVASQRSSATCYIEKKYVIAVWLKRVGSAFRDAVVYGLSALTCSRLTLKGEQLSFVKAVYEGKDVFVFLPTWFGNGICYQILPFFLYSDGFSNG